MTAPAGTRAVHIREFARRLWTSRTVENTFWVGASSAMGALLGAVGAALYARILGVGEYGVLMLIVSIVTMMIALADLGIGGSIVRFGAEMLARGDAPGYRAVLNVALRAKLILAGIVLLGALVLLDPIVGMVFRHVDSAITSYFLLSLIAAGLGMLAAYFPPVFQSQRWFRTLAAVAVSGPALKVVVLAVVAYTISAITVGQAVWIEIGTAAGLLFVSYLSAPKNSVTFTRLDRPLGRRMLSFNKWLSLYYVINLIGGRMDLFFVGGLADAIALGIYGAASKIASIVVIITNSYLTVLLPELSAAITPEEIRKKQRHAIVIVSLFSIGIAALALLADVAVSIVFGPKFAAAGPMIRVMCIGLFFTVAAYPVNATLFAWNRSEVFPIMSIAGIAALIGGNALFIPRMGAMGAAVAFSLSGTVGFLMSSVIYFLHLKTHAHASDDGSR
ncbi:MAG TPA: oligosaccharide flippase family protein [Bacteroidota bacterium]|nr:oligosaccharide flippase family protein [Bacteroidota bacterium]